MTNIRLIIAPALALGLVSSALAQEATARFGAEPVTEEILIRSTTDIDVFAPVVEAFVATRSELSIAYEQWGSNDLYQITMAACSGEARAADLVISSAIDLQVMIVNQGCAAAYASPATAALPAARNWRDEVFGVTQEPAVMIFNRDLVSESEAPASRFDLIDLLRPVDSRFAGKVATYDIEASGLGYLFAFVDSLQANTFGRLLEAFGRSGAVATCCSAEIIDAVAEGHYLIAYNVLGSYALARAAEDPRIGVRAPADYTLMLSRAALIPRRSEKARLAGTFIDFLLSESGKAVLRDAKLLVEIGAEDDADLLLPGGSASSLRPIALSPVLLAGLDRHKRMIFTRLWRQNLHSQ